MPTKAKVRTKKPQKKRTAKAKKLTKKPTKDYTVATLRAICRRNRVPLYSGRNKAWLLNHCFTRRDAVAERADYTAAQLRAICRQNGVDDYEGQPKSWLVEHCFSH